MINMLTEKDRKALDKKIDNSDIDSNILFEVFVMGLESDGDQTPQQKGFMSLNTFMAEDFDSPDKDEQRNQEFAEAMANWNDDPITGVQLDRRYNRPMVTKSTMPKLKEFKADYEDSFVADPVDPKKIDWKDSHITAAYQMGKRAKKGSKNPFHKKNDPEGQLHACWIMCMRGESMPKEALEYPHETAKKYKKDTPGQQVKETAAARATAQNKLEKIRQKERHKQEKERLATAHKNEVQRLKTNEAFEELLK